MQRKIETGKRFITLIQLFIERRDRKADKLKFQAKCISSWIESEGENKTICSINNLSQIPIYEVILIIVTNKGSQMNGKHAAKTYEKGEYPYLRKIDVVPPGKLTIDFEGLSHDMHTKFY